MYRLTPLNLETIPMINVYTNRTTLVAQINKQHPAADGYQHQLPWLLLMTDGRVRRFPSMGEAKDEAQKRWPSCRFGRN